MGRMYTTDLDTMYIFFLLKKQKKLNYIDAFSFVYNLMAINSLFMTQVNLSHHLKHSCSRVTLYAYALDKIFQQVLPCPQA